MTIPVNYALLPGLVILRAQLNAIAPDRGKASDGWIGDAAHMARVSDHNPRLMPADGKWWVSAIDVTHDPEHGMDGELLALALTVGRDARLKYVIWNRRIMEGGDDPTAWMWHPYTGTDPHTNHVHISAVFDQRSMTVIPWFLPAFGAFATRPTLRMVDAAAKPNFMVSVVQELIGALPDGVFGPHTDQAVRAFQRQYGLTVDGIVGPHTWTALRQSMTHVPAPSAA